MEHPNLAISLMILVLNVFTILLFTTNIVLRVRRAVNSKSVYELDFYFKLIMLSVIGDIMSIIAFYIGVKIWLKVDFLGLDSIVALRLVYAVLMGCFASLVSILDRRYNPFEVNKED